MLVGYKYMMVDLYQARIAFWRWRAVAPQVLVGASLLAMAAAHATYSPTDTPLSSERRPEQARSHRGYPTEDFRLSGTTVPHL